MSQSKFQPLKDTKLFTPVEIGALKLQHRIVLAPLTRMRGVPESPGIWAPGDAIVEHYVQRTTPGGLLLSEAAPISRLASGYPGIPGIFTPGQIAGWKRVTDAVHAKGGLIYCQIWHTGRSTVPSLIEGNTTVSSTTVPIKGKAVTGAEYSDTPPRVMTVAEIKEVVKEFGRAAKRALEAGFDGVEVHGANGYLIEQFLHDNVNTRTDEYGGSIENRSRIVLEIIKEITGAVGPERTGFRLSPYNYYQDTRDSDPNAHWAYICKKIAELPKENRPAFVHMVEPRFDEVLDEQGKLNALGGANKNSLIPFQKILAEGGVKFIAAGGFDRENSAPKVENGEADAIAIGRWFIANPDLPKRLAEGLPLNPYDRSTFYGADPPTKGYTDYSFYEA